MQDTKHLFELSLLVQHRRYFSKYVEVDALTTWGKKIYLRNLNAFSGWNHQRTLHTPHIIRTITFEIMDFLRKGSTYFTSVLLDTVLGRSPQVNAPQIYCRLCSHGTLKSLKQWEMLEFVQGIGDQLWKEVMWPRGEMDQN